MRSKEFYYNKRKVMQALRYHFVTRKEIRLMLILVNLFSILSAVLFFMKKISPLAFLISSVLWFTLMISFWYILPITIYKRAATFKDHFTAVLQDQHLFIENERGSKSWAWREFATMIESPHFFHLYFNSRSFFLIPKEAFEPDDIAKARKIFKEKISS